MVESSVILNALALFIPAMIGILGSYLLFRKKQQSTRAHLRDAFLAEMEGTEFLDIWADEYHDVPSFNFVSVTVYESNSDSLGLLSSEEVTAVVRFYTRAKAVQNILDIRSKLTYRPNPVSSGPSSSDVKSGTRAAIDKLELTRSLAVLRIKKNRTNLEMPSEGDLLGECPEIVSKNETILLDYCFAKHGADGVAISNQGEQFYRGDVRLAGLEKEHDVMLRNQGPYEERMSDLWQRIRRWFYTAIGS